MRKITLMAGVSAIALLTCSQANAITDNYLIDNYISQSGPNFYSILDSDLLSGDNPAFELFGSYSNLANNGESVSGGIAGLQLDYDFTTLPNTEISTETGLYGSIETYIDDYITDYHSNSDPGHAYASFRVHGYDNTYDPLNATAKFGGKGNTGVVDASVGAIFTTNDLRKSISLGIAGQGAMGYAIGTNDATVELVTGVTNSTSTYRMIDFDPDYYRTDSESIQSGASSYIGNPWDSNNRRGSLEADALGQGNVFGLRLSLTGAFSTAYMPVIQIDQATSNAQISDKDGMSANSASGGLDLGIGFATGSEGASVKLDTSSESYASAYYYQQVITPSSGDIRYNYDTVGSNDSISTSTNAGTINEWRDKKSENEEGYPVDTAAIANGNGTAKVTKLSITATKSSLTPSHAFTSGFALDRTKATATGIDGSVVVGGNSAESNSYGNVGDWVQHQHADAYKYYYTDNYLRPNAIGVAYTQYDIGSETNVPSKIVVTSVSTSHLDMDNEGNIRYAGASAANNVLASGSDVVLDAETQVQTGHTTETYEHYYENDNGIYIDEREYAGTEATTYSAISATTGGYGLVTVDHEDSSDVKVDRDGRNGNGHASTSSRVVGTSSPRQTSPGIYSSVMNTSIHDRAHVGPATTQQNGHGGG